MNPQPESLASALPYSLVCTSREQTPENPTVPIEGQMSLPAWIIRDPGSVVEIEDDQCDWE